MNEGTEVFLLAWITDDGEKIREHWAEYKADKQHYEFAKAKTKNLLEEAKASRHSDVRSITLYKATIIEDF